jgi:hypothetical protein
MMVCMLLSIRFCYRYESVLFPNGKPIFDDYLAKINMVIGFAAIVKTRKEENLIECGPNHEKTKGLCCKKTG